MGNPPRQGRWNREGAGSPSPLPGRARFSSVDPVVALADSLHHRLISAVPPGLRAQQHLYHFLITPVFAVFAPPFRQWILDVGKPIPCVRKRVFCVWKLVPWVRKRLPRTSKRVPCTSKRVPCMRKRVPCTSKQLLRASKRVRRTSKRLPRVRGWVRCSRFLDQEPTESKTYESSTPQTIHPRVQGAGR